MVYHYVQSEMHQKQEEIADKVLTYKAMLVYLSIDTNLYIIIYLTMHKYTYVPSYLC